MAAIKFGNRESTLKLEEIKCAHQTGVYCFILYDIKQPEKNVYEPSSQHHAVYEIEWKGFKMDGI